MVISWTLFFTILDIWLFVTTHPLSLCTYSHLNRTGISQPVWKGNIPEINNLLRYWPMFENFSRKTKVDKINTRLDQGPVCLSFPLLIKSIQYTCIYIYMYIYFSFIQPGIMLKIKIGIATVLDLSSGYISFVVRKLCIKQSSEQNRVYFYSCTHKGTSS